ncbi:TPA: histidinol-phosphate transaminase, partial [Candidatus Poribacteria bacterium]|nr:histidinol-phosphate transaminase [Candidatus Poribacteria bacterium]
LASNENPLGPAPMAVSAIKAAAEKVNLYPDGNSYYLKNDLAKHLNVKLENLILGNGSNEVLTIIGDTFVSPGDEVIYSEQAFVVYFLVANVCGAKSITTPLLDYTHDLQAMADCITDKTKVIFIANPNNPTGTMVNAQQVEAFMRRVPDDVLVAFDEAYYEYVERDDYPQTLKYVHDGRNVIVLRTFSKIYGLAGLRIGYGISNENVIELMNKVRQPFNASLIAQAAAQASLKDTEHVEKSRRNNSEGKQYLYAKLAELGIDYVPSEGNFILIHLNRSGQEVTDELLKFGVIVRPTTGYKFPNSIRVTVGTPEQNKRFIEALREVL